MAQEPSRGQVPSGAAPAVSSSEDWWAVGLGLIVLAAALTTTWLSRPADVSQPLQEYRELSEQIKRLEEDASVPAGQARSLRKERDQVQKKLATSPLNRWLARPTSWNRNPLRAFSNAERGSVLRALSTSEGRGIVRGVAGAFVCGIVLFGTALVGMGKWDESFPMAFLSVFLLAVLAYVLAGQEVIQHYNLEYALWALLLGLVISNTVGTPRRIRSAVRTELYIKTGLVLLGAEILFHQLMALGLPGILIAWIVTPVVLVSTYIFGQRVLRIPSRSLNMVISADMSVCGVSAAIATAAACRAKKEELSLAIGMSLTFTVIMMVALPAVIQGWGLGPVLGGAWIGGTIDSTGAVAAAGGILGDTALAVAATIKMIQNVLIGVIAFAVAVYWVTVVERGSVGAARPDLLEVWRRFPKFVIGFLAASVVFSTMAASGVQSEAVADAAISSSKTLRNWFFCLAFVSIGLETNFRELRRFFVGGKPLILYLCGQAFNLVLTLLMAWIMFTKVFPDAAEILGR